MYDCPIIPDGNTDGDDIFKGVHGGKLTDREKFFWDVCGPPVQLSVAFIVKFEVPAVVGAPEIRPEVFTLNPCGRDPEARLNVVGACPPVIMI